MCYATSDQKFSLKAFHCLIITKEIGTKSFQGKALSQALIKYLKNFPHAAA